jgi:hypothetical protein
MDDLKLKDTACFISELPKPEGYIINAGCEIRNVNRLILTHDHPNHIETTNEIKTELILLDEQLMGLINRFTKMDRAVIMQSEIIRLVAGV